MSSKRGNSNARSQRGDGTHGTRRTPEVYQNSARAELVLIPAAPQSHLRTNAQSSPTAGTTRLLVLNPNTPTGSSLNPYGGDGGGGRRSQGLVQGHQGLPASSLLPPYSGNGSGGNRSQGLVQERQGVPASYLPAYGGNGNGGSRSQGVVQDNQRRPSSNPCRPQARGAVGYVKDAPMMMPTISRPSYAQGNPVRT